jgi:hypothetical protein
MDACFRFGSKDEAIVRACLAAARRRARILGIRRFRSGVRDIGQAVAFIEIDGNTYALDIFLERLRRDLPTIAEATSSHRSPASRRALALGLIDILTRFRLSMYDRYDEDWIPTLRARRQPAYTLPHQLWTDNPALQARLSVTSELMADWHFGEVAPPVLLEELHTAAELILEELVNRRSKRHSFQELVELAVKACVFSPYPHDAGLTARYRAGAGCSPFEADRRDLLVSLKNVRKEVRHRGADSAQAWLDQNFWDVASLLEAMSLRVPPRAPTAGD